MADSNFAVEMTDNPEYVEMNAPSHNTLQIHESQAEDIDIEITSNDYCPDSMPQHTSSSNENVRESSPYDNPSEVSVPPEPVIVPRLTKERWNKRVEYTFNTIGFVVGLGNIWKFSSFCYEYGGGVFIPVYTFFYIILGLPVFLMELYMGQFTSRGCIECWGNCKVLRGIGVSTVAMGIAVLFPYTMFIVWSLKYFVLSCYSTSPWSNASIQAPCNPNCSYSAEIYFSGDGFHLGQSTGIGNLGIPHWEFILAAFFIWLIFFVFLFQGLKFSGKSVYISVLFPYLAGFILLGHSSTLPGAKRGLEDYVSTRNFLETLGNNQIWTDAAIQIMFSLSLGQGGLSVLASFNDLRSNLFMNSVLITFIDYVSSLFFGIIVFSYVGYVKYGLNLPIKTQWDGLQLLFIIVPQAISETNLAPFWSALFFLMLIVLAFDIALTLIRTAGVALYEGFPYLPHSSVTYINIGMCACGFLTSIAMTTSGGVYFFQLINKYVNSWGLLWTVLLSLFFTTTLYGGVEITIDIEYMLRGKKISLKIWKIAKYYFLVCWYVVTPIFLLYLIVSKWILLKTPLVVFGTPYPTWSIALAWLMSLCIPLCSIITWIIYLVKEKGPIEKRLKCLKNSESGSPLWSIATPDVMAELVEIKRIRREKRQQRNDV